MFLNRCNNKCTFDLTAPVKKKEKRREIIFVTGVIFNFSLEVFFCLKFKFVKQTFLYLVESDRSIFQVTTCICIF